MKRIGLVILGLGAHGPRILKHFERLSAALAVDGWDLRLVGGRDPDKAAIERCRALYPQLFSAPDFVDFDDATNLSSILTHFSERARRGLYQACLFYDASPTHYHLRHLVEVIDFQRRYLKKGMLTEPLFFYFGEKPILSFSEENLSFLDEALTRTLVDYPHWCNFIELKNPAFTSLMQYIKADDVRIHAMSIWRCNSVGLERYLHGGRKGVTGGAFMDKSIHDLPLILELLPDRKAEVHSVEAKWHLPFRLSPSRKEADWALSLAGELLGNGSYLPPAEASSKVTLKMSTAAHVSECVLNSSWLGLSSADRGEIEKIADRFSISLSDCVGERETSPEELQVGHLEEDVRLFHLVGTAADGTEIEVLANLLARDSADGWRNSLEPWVLSKKHDLVHRIPTDNTLDQLHDAFLDVLKDVVGEKRRPHNPVRASASALGHAMSLKVHDIAKEVRRTIQEAYADKRVLDIGVARSQAFTKIIPPACFVMKRNDGASDV